MLTARTSSFTVSLLLMAAYSQAGFSQTPIEAVVTNVSVGYCNDPHPSIGNFQTTDTKAEVFFRFATFPSGSMSLKWFGPGLTVDGGSWSNPSQYTCFISDLQIAGTPAANYPGDWHVEVYLNGTTIVNISFHIGPVQPRGPDYDGFFDPIATDCSHFGGWARDKNSTDPIAVDILVDGFTKLTGILANQPRSDLTGVLANHAWNKFDLQPYENGQSHQVHVYYGGTVQELPNSPQSFPPPGALSGCGGIGPSSIRTGHVVTLPGSPNGTIYYVDSTGLYPFATADSFYSWGFQFSSVTTANAAEAALPIQSIIIPTKIAGCSDPISQIKGTCGSTPLSIVWVSGSSPPSTMMSGQSSQVNWRVAGPAQIQSRLCYGTSSDPATICQQFATYWQNSGTNTSGTYGDTIIAPPVNSQQTIYVVAQAQANGQTVYTTPTAQVTILSVQTPPLSGQTWVYTNNTNGNLAGSVVVLQRAAVGGSTYRYTWYVVADSTHSPFWNISGAMLTVLYKNSPAILAKRSTATAQVLNNTILTPSTDVILQNLGTAPWQNVGRSVLTSDQIDVVLTTLGFIPWGVGNAADVVAAVKTAASLFPADSLGRVHSSNTFQGLLQQDSYNTVNMTASDGGLLGFNICGMRFSIDVDEFGGETPFFLLRFEQSGAGSLIGGGVIGLEIQTSRDNLSVTRWP